jgi:hypothetical protein
MPGDAELRPWERQPAEDDEQWRCFQNFRDQVPPRRMAHAGVKRAADLSTWYNDHRWKERAAAYDRHLDEIRREQREAIHKLTEQERATRQLGQLAMVQDIIDLELSKLWADAKRSEAFGLVKVSDLNKLLNSAITLERLVRGQSTENVAVDIDLEKLSVEELRELRELQDKMGRGE